MLCTLGFLLCPAALLCLEMRIDDSTEGNAAQREVKPGLLLLESTWKILLPTPIPGSNQMDASLPSQSPSIPGSVAVWLEGREQGGTLCPGAFSRVCQHQELGRRG